MTALDRWQVFKGDSKDSSDLLFSAKRSSMFQLKTKLDVFLANNTKEEVCDFKVKGSWLERSRVVYAGESSTIVAQVSFFFFFPQSICTCSLASSRITRIKRKYSN